MKLFGGCLAGIAVCGILFVWFLCFVFSVGARGVIEKEIAGPELALKDWKFDGEHGFTWISGRVKNTSGRELRYAEIRFKLEDDSGNHIGTAWTNTTNLAAGAVWKFKAHCTGKAMRGELAELKGH